MPDTAPVEDTMLRAKQIQPLPPWSLPVVGEAIKSSQNYTTSMKWELQRRRAWPWGFDPIGRSGRQEGDAPGEVWSKRRAHSVKGGRRHPGQRAQHRERIVLGGGLLKFHPFFKPVASSQSLFRWGALLSAP